MAILAFLSRALDARDPGARAHALRVTALAEHVARQLGWSDHDVRALRLGGVVHDLGKLAVARDVLAKPAALTAEERAQIEAHPLVGARLAADVGLAGAALPYVLHHHERWDGSGYPGARAGSAIPLGARILAVADAFDAMTSERPYRRPLSVAEALAEVERCAGSQFDAAIAEAFLAVARGWSRPRAWSASG